MLIASNLSMFITSSKAAQLDNIIVLLDRTT